MTDSKVIAVTGASRGIGSAIVEELARRGHTVGCLSRKGQGPEDREVSPAIAERFINVACDITDEAGIKKALKALAERAGRIDALVNNAGVYFEKKVVDITTAEFEEMVATNLTAVFVMCREIHPYLIAAGGGVIVNIGSYYEQLGVRYSAPYNAAKAGVGALTRCLAVEWAREGIRVLDVAPGIIITDINREYLGSEGFRNLIRTRVPVGEPGTPEQVGKLVAALLGEDLPFFTGETIHIDGGQSVAV